MPKLNDITIHLYAQIENKEQFHLGDIAIPIKIGTVVRTSDGVEFPATHPEVVRDALAAAFGEIADAIVAEVGDPEPTALSSLLKNNN